MKRKISLYMALILIFQMIATWMPTAKVWAATTELVADLNYYMAVGTNNTTPIITANTSKDDQTLLYWDVKDFQPNERYKLDYFIDDGMQAELTVWNNNDYYMVDFNLIDVNTGENVTAAYKTVGQRPTGVMPSLRYAVYAPPFSVAPVAINNLFSLVGYDANPRVNNRNPYASDYPDNPNLSAAELVTALATDPLYYHRLSPSFNITPNTGFSFTFYGYTLSVLWDARTNRFCFSTDGLSTGRIYEFNLSHLKYSASGGTNWTPCASRKAFTGIDMTTFAAIPIAGGNTGNNRATLNEDLKNEPDYDYVHPENTANAFDTSTIVFYSSDDALPARDDLQVSLRFDLPKVYDPVQNRFVTADATNFTDELIVTLNLSNTIRLTAKDLTRIDVSNEDKGLNQTIDSKGRVTLNSAECELTAASRIKGFDPNDASKTARTVDTERIEIILSGFDPGIIFNPANFTYTGSTTLATRSRSTDIYAVYRPIFTFVDFDVQLIGSNLFIGVQPYANASRGEYRLMIKNATGAQYIEQATLTPSITRPAGDTDMVWFPLEIDPMTNMGNIYQVQYTENFFNQQDARIVYSQIIEFTPRVPEQSVGSPNNFTIMKGTDQYYPTAPVDKSVFLYPLENVSGGEKGVLEFWTRWDIGDQRIMNQLLGLAGPQPSVDVTYEVYQSLTPMDDPNYIPVLFDTVTLHITPSTTSGSPLIVSYSDSKGKLVNTAPENLKTRANAPANTVYTCFADVHFKTDAALAKSGVNTGADFYYPNIYFLNVKPVKLAYGTVTKNLEIPESAYDNMTLNDLSQLAVPPPQDLAIAPYSVANGDPENRAAVHVAYSIPGGGVKQYLDATYPYENTQVTVNLYVGQYEDAIKKLFFPSKKILTLAERKALSDFTGDYTDFTGATGLILDMSKNNAREVLRSGKASGVVCIENIPLLNANGTALTAEQKQNILNGNRLDMSLLLDNLDINQKYYVFADLVIARLDQNGNLLQYSNGSDIIDASILTGVVGATTPSDINVPESAEKVPPAPVLSVDATSVDQTVAGIYWNKIALDSNETGVTVEYEIIRLKDRQMSDTLFNQQEPDFPVFFGNVDNREKVAWRTDGADITLYNATRRAFEPVTGKDQYVYSALDPVTLTDKTLLPNQLYFYYVRTVRETAVSDPQLGAYTKRTVSTWSRVSVTTRPVQNPANLKIENGRSDYDKQTEIIISFDTPVLEMDRLGLDYIPQYQIKADDGAWSEPVSMEVSQLKDPKNYAYSADGLTIRFTYKITGLKANTAYSLRVRLYDINMKDGSLYTNIAQFKTDINQQEYDDKVKTDEWLEFLRKQLEKMIKDPYWLARETAAELTVIYRPGDMFNGMLGASADGAVTLYGNNADTVTYYIPASVWFAAQSAGKGFRVSYDDLDILLPSGLINTNDNAAIASMAGEMKSKTVSDYFVRVSVTRSRVYGLVEGDTALGRQTRMNVELAGVIPGATDIKTWDSSLYTQFAAMVDAKINDAAVREGLLAEIEQGTFSEDMIQYVEKIAAGIKSDLLKAVYDQLRTTGSGILSTRTTTVSNFDAPMTLVAKGLDTSASVNGYQSVNGVWMPRVVNDYYNGKGILSSSPGVFVFTGHTVNIAGIENVPNGGTMTSLTAKYGLDDYLGKDNVNLNQSATRLMVAGCVARLAGAPKSADPITWVASNLNMTLSSRNANGNVQNQEAIAMVMALYEKKTNTKISSIAIRNYNTTAGMTDLDTRYAPAVRAAFEVGIAADTGLRPTGAVSVGALLDMLAALDNKVKQ